VLAEKNLDRGTIGIEEDACMLSTFKKLQTALPKAHFKPVDELFQIVKLVKEAEEIKLIKESVSIAEAGLQAGMEAAGVGVLESDIQKAAEIEMKRRGAIREIETMCQSGIRTANHRAFAANWKKVAENELVMIDIGCVYKGYGSDLTRTWVVGKPDKFYQKIADDLVRVREKTLNFIKPGVIVGQIRDFGREEMKKAGYLVDKKLMPSNKLGLGGVGVHGIGLGPMHDPPQSDEKQTILPSGVTIAVSCCARFADFTIRFEDNVVIEQSGVRLLNEGLPWKL
jgi:Xaa-Pro aminopeptidase